MLLPIRWRKNHKVPGELGSVAFVDWSTFGSNILFMLNFISIEVCLNLVLGCLIHNVVDGSGYH